MKKKSAIISLLLMFIISSFTNQPVENLPEISFSFDDGSIRDFPNYTSSAWDKKLLSSLQKHEAKAIFYIKGANLDNEKGREIIRRWDNSGHLIGNHTYSHPSLNSEKTSLSHFKRELLQNDSLIKRYQNYTKLFRFPFLKEGNTLQKRDGFRNFLKANGYRIGHVTIDASDWYIDSRLVKRLRENPQADLTAFKNFYIKHLFERAEYYNGLGLKLTGRHVSHNLLLHHNLASALFLDDLIIHFKNKGWKIVDVDNAYKDKIYNEVPNNLPAGESLIWALAKQSGDYDSDLRYPAEDSRYEKEEMDRLGL